LLPFPPGAAVFARAVAKHGVQARFMAKQMVDGWYAVVRTAATCHSLFRVSRRMDILRRSAPVRLPPPGALKMRRRGANAHLQANITPRSQARSVLAVREKA